MHGRLSTFYPKFPEIVDQFAEIHVISNIVEAILDHFEENVQRAGKILED